MDPNATLSEILNHFLTGEDPERAAELLRALADWIDKGGVMPDINDPRIAGIFDRQTQEET